MGKNTQVLGAAERGGPTPFALLSDGTKAGVIKAAPGQVYGISLSNVNAAAAFFKLYDKATAPSTSDVPVYRCTVGGGTTGVVRDIVFPVGLKFSVGIAWRLVTTVPDNGDTAPASNEVTVSGSYK
jgi:hypothetical protein